MDLEEKIRRVPEWRHRMELAPGVWTPGKHNNAGKLKKLQLPERLDGQRVLDIGAADGYFSFECERRGAKEVVALDVRQPEGFSVAKEALGSNVEYVQGSLYDVDLGSFDLILCLNVLYHVKEVYTAIERLRELCSGKVIVLTWVIDKGYVLPDGTTVALEDIAPKLKDAPIMQFVPAVEKYKDVPSYWVMSASALTAMMERAGFTVDDYELMGHDRALLWAHADGS